MDAVRQIRILIPPFFFFAAILLGAHFDTENLVRTVVSDVESTQSLLGVIAAAAVFVIPFGFFIGGITRLSLTALCWALSKFVLPQPVWFETWPPDRSNFVARIWPFLGSSLPPDVNRLFYATVTFDHHVLYGHARGIHEWLLRRWSGFSAASGSCVSLLLAVPGSFALGIEWTKWSWWPGHLVFIFVLAILCCTALRNWLDTMRMLAFQSHRDFVKIRASG